MSLLPVQDYQALLETKEELQKKKSDRIFELERMIREKDYIIQNMKTKIDKLEKFFKDQERAFIDFKRDYEFEYNPISEPPTEDDDYSNYDEEDEEFDEDEEDDTYWDNVTEKDFYEMMVEE